MSQQYLLDTGPLAAYLLGRSHATFVIAPWIAENKAVTSIIVYGEVCEYFKGMRDFELRHKELRELLQVVTPLVLTYNILDRYADLRRALRPPHGPGLIDDLDTLVAATALEYGLPVVTKNVKHFARIPGLEAIDFDKYEEATS
ncbi:type II toxin-antitoxin system VapC family toxin [Streptomyces sp. NPDC047082]|uniref:type II toxin-antitoxin system VapC family toxin n=1 Tax=Streptomyces sp. NPDC047082 TaxID=3155259 RepID=UPI0033D77F27